MKKSQESYYGNLREKTIGIRLESVASATSRTRKIFLIMTIFCAAINIALWNGYLSWVRGIAMPAITNTLDKCATDSTCYCDSKILKFFIVAAKNNINKQIASAKATISEDFTKVASKKDNKKPSAESKQTVTPTPEYTENRKALVNEWIKSQTISFTPLGINITTFDLAVLGSLSLVIVMIWYFFAIRRENRTIVPFLKEVSDEVRKIKIRKNRLEDQESKDLANLVFLGIVNNTVFINIADNDNPSKLTKNEKGEIEIILESDAVKTFTSLLFIVYIAVLFFMTWLTWWSVPGYLSFLIVLIFLIFIAFSFFKRQKVEDKIFNLIISKTILIKGRLIRWVSLERWWRENKDEAFIFRWIIHVLIFLPSITIFLIILSDIASLFNYSAYRKADALLIEVVCSKAPEEINKIILFEIIAFISFSMTGYLSLRSVNFSKAISESLNTFYKEFILNK